MISRSFPRTSTIVVVKRVPSPVLLLENIQLGIDYLKA